MTTDQSFQVFEPDISGFEYLLPNEGNNGNKITGFKYTTSEGLKIIIHGPAGSGKTMLALQLAIAGLGLNKDKQTNKNEYTGRNIIYFSKDSSSETLLYRILFDFNLFQKGKVTYNNIDKSENEQKNGNKKLILPEKEKDNSNFKDKYKKFISFVTIVGKKTIGIVCLDKLINFILNNGLQNNDVFKYCLNNNEFRIIESTNDKRMVQEYLKEGNTRHVEVDSILAFGNINSVSGLDIRFNKYAINTNIFMGLSALYPKYQPVMSFLEHENNLNEDESRGKQLAFDTIYKKINKYNKNDDDTKKNWEKLKNKYKLNEDYIEALKEYIEHEENLKSWHKKFMIVIDALPPEIIDECFKLYSESISYYKTNPYVLPPITVVVMENEELPGTMAYSYPPDIQIRLSVTDTDANIRKKTIQILKARYQKIYDEPHPFLITDYNKESNNNKEEVFHIKTIEFNDKKFATVEFEDKCMDIIEKRKIGINILPVLSSVAIIAEDQNIKYRKREPVNIKFGIETFDKNIIEENNLTGGGLTLLITENRCHSTALGLHFLLGQIAEDVPDKVAKDPQIISHEKNKIRSVLYISFSNSLRDIINTIFNFKNIRKAVFGDFSPANNEDDRLVIKEIKNINDEDHYYTVRLYRIALKSEINTKCSYKPNKDNVKIGMGFLYILIPDLTWAEPEEILEKISRLLKYSSHINNVENGCKKCQQIDRVLLDRVSSIKMKMPSLNDIDDRINIKDHSEEKRQRIYTFVTSIIELCRSKSIDIMIVDDTVKEGSIAGTIPSHWSSSARNILSLKRISFQGTETVMMDIIKATARTIRRDRPQELQKIFKSINEINNYELKVSDTFRGFTGIRSGAPERIMVKISLHCDKKNGPLHNQLEILNKNFTALLGITDIQIIEAQERKINCSALINLAPVGQNICHVVDIDEIWLPRLLENNCLSTFTKEHIISIYKDLSSLEDLKKHYITQGCDYAMKLTGVDDSLYAIPFRHNWGLLTVSRIKKEYADEMKKRLLEDKPDDKTFNIINAIIFLTSEPDKNFDIDFDKMFTNKDEVKEIFIKLFNLIWENHKKILEKLSQATVNTKESATWDDLVHFKTNYWEIIKTEFNKKFNAIVNQKQDGEDDKKNKIEYTFFFFNFDNGTTDSIVAFFMELILAHIQYDGLLQEYNENSGGLFFKIKHDETCIKIKEAFRHSLLVMYNLLDQNQRDNIVCEYNLQEEKCKDSNKKTFAFITRDWCSTIPILEPGDIRQSIELRYLPIAANNPYYKEIFSSYFSSQNKNIKPKIIFEPIKSYEYFGIPVSGTWYLATLSGGNKEVAVDIIREIISETHERERYAYKVSPPVRVELYKDSECNKGNSNFIPYMDIIHKLIKTQENESENDFLNMKIHFPFPRTYIYKYVDISDRFYQTIKTIMAFPKEMMEYSTSKDFKIDKYSELQKEVDLLITHIYTIQNDKERG